jgi:uncharacterized membrane protein
MNKERIEIFSDGVFAIVMTLLVIDIKVPELEGVVGNTELWRALFALWPLFASYYFSFFVLSVLWINHHFFFHSFAKAVDRHLNLMNLAVLMFIAFVPFSAHLLGAFETLQPAVLIYGLNILIVVLITACMVLYVEARPELMNEELPTRVRTQAHIRVSLTIVSYLIGLALSFFYLPLSFFFYFFPMVFNLLPGTLNLAERVFRFKIT